MFFSTYLRGFPPSTGIFGNSGRGHMMGSNKSAQFGKTSFGENLISSGNMSVIEPQASNGDKLVPISQICFKSGHTTAECWHKYIENYIPQSPRQFNKESLLDI